MIEIHLHSVWSSLHRQTTSQAQLLKYKVAPLFVSITIFALLISGCSPDVEVSPTSITPSITPDPTQTLEPAPTTSPPVVVFIPPSNDFLALSEPISSTLETLSAQVGWSYVVANQLTPEIIREEIKVAVFFDPSDEILEMIETNDDTQFIAIGVEGFLPRENLNLIGPDGFRLDRQAFLGGYIAALMTQDWRVGEIIDGPDQQLSMLELSFRNGVKFYCGLCLLTYPPFHNYPISSTLDSDWKSSIELLQTYSVITAFLFVEGFNLDAINNLLEADLLLLGITSPPDSLRSNWVATIRHKPEQVLIEKWGDIITGSGGWVEDIPLMLEDVDHSKFSEGKQRFIDKILVDIQAGYIDPAVTPPAPIGD